MRKPKILFSIILLLIVVLIIACVVKGSQKKSVATSISKVEIENNQIENINSIIPQNNSNEVSTINKKEDNKNNSNKKDNKKTSSTEKYKDVNETVYAIAKVHIRKKDNVNSKILATLKTGDTVKRIGIGDNGWSKIEYNNKEGYIYTQYISTEKPPEAQEIDLNIDPNRKIDSSKPMLALTFDDGPNPNSTPKILATLEKYNCVATFFDLGIYMESYPEITQKEEAIGCEVGSHTYAHKNLDNLSKDQILEDIKKAEKVYKSTLGHDLTMIRPPYGNANSTVRLTLNYPLINWDVDTEDWKSKDKKSILAQIKKVGNLDGRIVLMHSIYDSTADAIEELIPQLLKEGYQLVTVSELANYKGVELKTHTSYWGLK